MLDIQKKLRLLEEDRDKKEAYEALVSVLLLGNNSKLIDMTIFKNSLLTIPSSKFYIF